MRANRQPFDADLVLDDRPFYGDETDVTLLSDKIVRAAKPHPHCHTCHGPIIKNERHRAYTERNNEERMVATFRSCALCCVAVALDARDQDRTFSDPDRLWQSRYRIGEWRREQDRRAAASEDDA